MPNVSELQRKDEENYDYTSAIIAFETGELDWDGTIELFQYLVDTGLAWKLQGTYGRAAQALINAGHVSTANVD